MLQTRVVIRTRRSQFDREDGAKSVLQVRHLEVDHMRPEPGQIGNRFLDKVGHNLHAEMATAA